MGPSTEAPNVRGIGYRPPAPTPGVKIDGPQVTSTGEKYGLFRMPTCQDEYISCEKRFDWLQSEKNHLEKALNKLTIEYGVIGPGGRKLPAGSKASFEEVLFTPCKHTNYSNYLNNQSDFCYSLESHALSIKFLEKCQLYDW